MLRPVQAARSLSTRNLTGITLYSPNELVISARAGTPLAEIEATLAEHGQHIIAEPPDLAAIFGSREPQTLGGVVATNLSGPRRVAWGAMRDHVLGIRAVTGHGEVIHSGGRVLKNVTGLDLCKLLTGSHGTLGVITEVTLKVLPAPEAVGTVVLPGLDAAAGVAALSAALGSPYSVSAAAWLPAEAAAPHSRAGRLRPLRRAGAHRGYSRHRWPIAPPGCATTSATDDARSSTMRHRAPCGGRSRDLAPLSAEPADAVWRVSVRPSAGPAVLRALSDAVGARGYLDWGGGLVWIAGTGDRRRHMQRSRRPSRQPAAPGLLMRAPESLRAAVDVIPPEPEPLARITRRVKAALDPHGILNPGRMYGGL